MSAIERDRPHRIADGSSVEERFLNALLTQYYTPALWLYAGMTLVTFVSLFFITAPYGRHTRDGWGPTMRAAHAWFIMELVALITVPALAIASGVALTPAMIALLGLWVFHYGHRTLIYPWRRRTSTKRLPILIPAMAIAYNALNGYANGWNFFVNAELYQMSWLLDPRFILGTIIFACGAWINITSDNVMLKLQRRTNEEYEIPHEGLHRHVAAPNYLGEIMEWAGWAIATWSTAGLLFALYTIANLAPRARSNLIWYRETFPDYPKDRKALIPHVW